MILRPTILWKRRALGGLAVLVLLAPSPGTKPAGQAAPGGMADDPRREAFRTRLRPLMTEVLDRIDDAQRAIDRRKEAEIAIDRAKAELDAAQKASEIRELALHEYEEGTYPQELRTLQLELELVTDDLARAKKRLDWAADMVKRGAISQAEYLVDQQTHLKMQLVERNARTRLKLLEQFAKPRQVNELKSEIEKAKADELAKESLLRLQRSAQAQQVQDDRSALLPEESRAVILLDEAILLGDAWLADPNVPRDAQSRAVAKLDEAERVWKQAKAKRLARQDVAAKARLRQAAEAVREAKTNP